jgi:hypothetical protein
MLRARGFTAPDQTDFCGVIKYFSPVDAIAYTPYDAGCSASAREIS